MRKSWLGRVGLVGLVGSAVLGSGVLAGCAGERDPIDRTQQGVLNKSFFVGANLEDFRDDPEFRTKSFNIDSAANTDNYSGTIGGASAVDRVRWEITENMLFARRSYQESPGADNRGLPRKEVSPGKWEFPGKPNGTIIAAYRIVNHFDVRRDYNSSTGEEMNVIVENSSDRPWYQRQQMRVDWSMNLADSTSGDTSWVWGGNAKGTPIQYSPTNENDEDRPHFEEAYFDVTNKFTLASEEMPGWGIPECVIIGYFNGTSSFDCTPTEVKFRSSFERLTGNEDFEPFEESKAQRDIVGNWGNAGNTFNREYGAPPITAWDPQYGYTDAKTKAFYSLHNIWTKSHQDKACTSNVDDDADGSADQCANTSTGYKGSKGSQCDVHIGKCTLPVRDRQIKTVGYWLNKETPVELTDTVAADGKTVTQVGAIEEMTITWDQLLKSSVATRREVECRRTKDGDRDTCHSQFFAGQKDMVAFGGWGLEKTKDLPVDKGQPVIATCHNPVRAYDPTVCGKVGEATRLGDVRKNFTIYWPFASRAPYGGVASIGADPLTGEMVGATATIMGRSATAAAAQQRDIIQLAIGDVKVEDLIVGGQATRYADTVKNGRVNEAMAHGKSPAEHQAIRERVNLQQIKAATGADALGLDAMSPTQRTLAKAKLHAKDSVLSPRIAADTQRLEGLLGQLNGNPLQADLADKNLRQLVANSPNKQTSVYQAIKNFSQRDSSQVQDLFDQYQAYLGNKGVCFHDSAASATSGSIYQAALAPYFKKKYDGLEPKERGVKIYSELLREAVKGIGFHEIGHSIGMRHNFSSSWDSMNYAPQYWQLRTNEGKSVGKCAAAGRTGGPDTCMGPRYLDPMTDDEQGLADEARPGIEYFANTSTMEYQIERFGETVGAGTYDLHFMKTVYGRVLETMDEREIEPEKQQYFAVKTLSQGIPSNLVFDPTSGYGVHYTKQGVLAKVFDPDRDCRPATDAEIATAKWRIVHGKVCSPSPKNHLAYEDMKSSGIEFTDSKGVNTPIGVAGVRWAGTDENGTKLVRWHYRYGEDYSRGGYIHAKLFDSGADIYETTVNVTRRFDLTYPWQYFRRLNKEFAWWSVAGSVTNSTFSRLRAYHWNTTTDLGRASAADAENPDQDQPAAYASQEMFNFLQRVILMPEPGMYGTGADTTLRTPTRYKALKIFDITEDEKALNQVGAVGIVDGRYIQVDFNNELGGSWDYFHFPEHVGFDDEKIYALREMVDSRPTLSTISRENALDGRDPYISFRTDNPHAMDRLLGGILAQDWETIAPSMLSDKQTLKTFSLLDRDPSKLTRPAGSSVIFPNTGYSNAISMSIYSMLFSRFSTDMVLAQKLRIRQERDSGARIPDNKRLSFTDPVTGFRYDANRFGNELIQGRQVETGIASRVLQRANELVAQAYQVREVEMTDTSTTPPTKYNAPFIDAFGEVELVLTNGAPTVKNATAAANLRRYIGLIDGLRQVGNIFGGGPLGGGGGGGDED
ncbi:MAG: hypothetical protein IPQ09_29515 [Myxococcales bacterium]|nr:hypothetical protein [Myxococcales bacterium]